MLSANRTCAKNVQTNRTSYPLTGSVQKSHALLRVINNLSALLFCIGWVASCRSRSPCQHGIIRSYRAVKLKITFCTPSNTRYNNHVFLQNHLISLNFFTLMTSKYTVRLLYLFYFYLTYQLDIPNN